MNHEIGFFGLLFPSLLLCAVVAGLLWFALDWCFLKVSAWSLFWHPPLARMALYGALFSLVAAFWPNF